MHVDRINHQRANGIPFITGKRHRNDSSYTRMTNGKSKGYLTVMFTRMLHSDPGRLRDNSHAGTSSAMTIETWEAALYPLS